MLFTSDNWAPVHPAIMDAIVRENANSVPAYGGDDLTVRAAARFNEIFETDCAVFYASTGGAANGLALSQLVKPYNGIFCHEVSHVQMDECATPEFYTGGAKLLTLPGEDGKLTPASLAEGMRFYSPPMTHHVLPKALSLTQGTEAGTVYRPEEIRALTEEARRHGLNVHMDGARFANALARLGCSPAELTWKAGVDVLSLGATKNGALAAEAVVFFNPQQAEEFAWRQKRAGHVWSKARFISAQWLAWFDGDLWMDLARMANDRASELASGLSEIDGVMVELPAEINEVFVTFPEGIAEKLLDAGARFYDWVYPGDWWDGRLKRLVTSYTTEAEEVEKFISLVRRLAGEV